MRPFFRLKYSKFNVIIFYEAICLCEDERKFLFGWQKFLTSYTNVWDEEQRFKSILIRSSV